MDKKYYLERYNKRIRNLQRNFEPIMFVGFDKDKIGEESNYLKIIFKVDQVNSYKTHLKNEYDKMDGLNIAFKNKIDLNSEPVQQDIFQTEDQNMVFKNLKLGLNAAKKEMICIRLDSKFFQLNHDVLMDTTTKIEGMVIDEEDIADEKLTQGFSDFWDWAEFFAQKKQKTKQRKIDQEALALENTNGAKQGDQVEEGVQQEENTLNNTNLKLFEEQSNLTSNMIISIVMKNGN